jgi:hypothetical protein
MEKFHYPFGQMDMNLWPWIELNIAINKGGFAIFGQGNWQMLAI